MAPAEAAALAAAVLEADSGVEVVVVSDMEMDLAAAVDKEDMALVAVGSVVAMMINQEVGPAALRLVAAHHSSGGGVPDLLEEDREADHGYICHGSCTQVANVARNRPVVPGDRREDLEKCREGKKVLMDKEVLVAESVDLAVAVAE